MNEHAKKHDKKVDRSVDMSFPASDPPAHSSPTSTEPPKSRIDRKPPVISKEQIKQAQAGDGHKHQK